MYILNMSWLIIYNLQLARTGFRRSKVHMGSTTPLRSPAQLDLAPLVYGITKPEPTLFTLAPWTCAAYDADDFLTAGLCWIYGEIMVKYED